MRCYDPQKRALAWAIPNAHKGCINTIYADANYILSGGDDGPVRVWARVTRQLLIQLAAHTKQVTKVMPDLNQPHIIHSCGTDRAICTFDLKKEKKINGHSIKNGVIMDMCQRKDRELELITCGQGSPIFFWDCDEAEPVAFIDYQFKVSSLQVSNSGKYLAFGSETSEVFVYDITDQGKMSLVGKGAGHSGPVMKLKWSPDDKQVVSVAADASICVWNFYG